MIERKRSEIEESTATFAVCIALVNFLILSIIGGFCWLAFFAINETASINAIIQGKFLP